MRNPPPKHPKQRIKLVHERSAKGGRLGGDDACEEPVLEVRACLWFGEACDAEELKSSSRDGAEIRVR